jgi:hypothetical protein
MSIRRTLHVALCDVVLLSGIALPREAARAQVAHGFGVCKPRSQRASAKEVGCIIITERAVGRLGAAPVYWHVARFPSRALANAAARDTSAHATVVEAFGHVWLLAIGARERRFARGREVATIGPLPIDSGVSYKALYMEASMRPGMKSGIHRHSGPEAWYTMSGETCLETPSGTQVGRADNPPVIVPGGPPMELTATGTTLRTSLVLILHDASRPPTTAETEWKPRGLCGSAH